MLFHIDVISSLKIALRHKLIMKEKEMLERSYFHWELPVNNQKRNKNEKSRTTFLENTGSEMFVLFMMHFFIFLWCSVLNFLVPNYLLFGECYIFGFSRMDRQRREDDLKNRPSKKAAEAEQSISNRVGQSFQWVQCTDCSSSLPSAILKLWNFLDFLLYFSFSFHGYFSWKPLLIATSFLYRHPVPKLEVNKVVESQRRINLFSKIRIHKKDQSWRLQDPMGKSQQV